MSPPGRRPAPVAVPDAAALYDWECEHVLGRRDQDLGYWLALARDAGGAVLELACGTGRLTRPLAAAGVDIVGLDHDVVMLRAARRATAGPPATGVPHRVPLWVAADMRRFALARRFALVLVAYNSLQLLTAPGDMMACLQQAREHLAPRGTVAVEVTDFQVDGADGPDEAPMLLADAGGIRLWATLSHAFTERTSTYQRRFEGDGWAVESRLVVRSLDDTELASLLHRAGLRPMRTGAAGHVVRAVAERAP